MGQAGGAMHALLDRMEGGGKVRESLALAYWPRVVGPHVASASHAEEVRDGILLVRTKGSVWSQEISLLKHRILSELNRLCGKPVIKDIRFRASGVPPAEEDESEHGPTDEELAALRFTPEELAELQHARAEIATVPDKRMRRPLLRIAERRHRLRRWRLDHGWRVCSGCDVLHDGPGDLCTVCEAER